MPLSTQACCVLTSTTRFVSAAPLDPWNHLAHRWRRPQAKRLRLGCQPSLGSSLRLLFTKSFADSRLPLPVVGLAHRPLGRLVGFYCCLHDAPPHPPVHHRSRHRRRSLLGRHGHLSPKVVCPLALDARHLDRLPASHPHSTEGRHVGLEREQPDDDEQRPFWYLAVGLCSGWREDCRAVHRLWVCGLVSFLTHWRLTCFSSNTVSFHQQTYQDRMREQKFQIRVLVALYQNSSDVQSSLVLLHYRGATLTTVANRFSCYRWVDRTRSLGLTLLRSSPKVPLRLSSRRPSRASGRLLPPPLLLSVRTPTPQPPEPHDLR